MPSWFEPNHLSQGMNELPVVAVVVPVVELVVERTQDEYRPAPEGDGLEPRMRRGRTQCVPLHVEQDVDGMRHDQGMNQDAAQVDHVLDGVHGQAGPGSEVVVAVVHRVGHAVERLPVQQAMNEVEVQGGPERDRDESEHEPHRMGGRVEVKGEPAIGMSPERTALRRRSTA